jgi:phage regulator Rha-like protein
MLALNNQLTMSSREIADLLNKNHSDIKRSAKRLSDAGILTQPLAEYEFAHKGNVYTEYKLIKRDCFVLVAQNCPEFTAAIVDRWQELENGQFKIPQTYSEALQLCADQAKELELAAPKVAFVERLVERESLLTATQVAQKHGMSAIKLNKILDELGCVYSKAVKRSRVFKQEFIDKGYGKIKQNDCGHDQALFTNAGEYWICKKLISEGVVDGSKIEWLENTAI